MFLSRDGLQLAYAESGTGSPPIVLVHGWCENAAQMRPLHETLANARRVVSVDLRGHGRSDVPDDDCSIAGFADDVAWMADELDLGPSVLVGHSMGGAVVLELARQRPDLSRAVIAIEGTILFPPATRELATPMAAALRSPSWQDVLLGYIDSLFSPYDDPDVKRAVLDDIRRMRQHVAASCAESTLAWDAEGAAAACSVPVLYIDAGGELSDLDRFAELCPQLVVGRAVCVGHDQMVASPEQVTTMIDRFLEVTLKAREPVATTA